MHAEHSDSTDSTPGGIFLKASRKEKGQEIKLHQNVGELTWIVLQSSEYWGLAPGFSQVNLRNTVETVREWERKKASETFSTFWW